MKLVYEYYWKYESPNDRLVKVYFKTKIKKYLVAEILHPGSMLDYKLKDYFGADRFIEIFFGFRRLINHYLSFNKIINKYNYINFNWMRAQFNPNDNYYVFIKYTIWFKIFYAFYNLKINNLFVKPFRKIYTFIKNLYADAYLFLKTKFCKNKNIDALTEFYHSK